MNAKSSPLAEVCTTHPPGPARPESGKMGLDTGTTVLVAVLASVGGIIILALIWLRKKSSSPPILVFKKQGVMDNLIHSCPSLLKNFTPSLCLLNGHISTIFGSVMRKTPNFSYQRELLRIGGCLDLCHCSSKQTMGGRLHSTGCRQTLIRATQTTSAPHS